MYLGIMKHIKHFRRITSSIQQNRLLSSRVIWQKRRNIQNLSIHNDPDVILLVVLGDIGGREFLSS